MIINPKYAETIIVLVKINETYKWFITDKDVWFLDLKKLISTYLEKGFEIPNPEDFSDRFNIAIVNENTAEEFLQRISRFEVKIEELKEMLVQKTYHHISDMYPSLYVDFDMKELISYYPEPASYEQYVPSGWEGKYEELTEHIPISCAYWIINGQNILLGEEQ